MTMEREQIFPFYIFEGKKGVIVNNEFITVEKMANIKPEECFFEYTDELDNHYGGCCEIVRAWFAHPYFEQVYTFAFINKDFYYKEKWNNRIYSSTDIFKREKNLRKWKNLQ